MTDLEMTRLCAEAMGIEYQEIVYGSLSPEPYQVLKIGEEDNGVSRSDELYDPLHDDDQVMALLKRFGLTCELCAGDVWQVGYYQIGQKGISAADLNLNRAIVECCANMQKARSTEAVSSAGLSRHES